MSERVFEGHDSEVRNRTKTMLMYFVVFAVTMLFAGFTSAYIVSNMGQFWVHVPAPSMFWTSNVMIALSSATLWWATRAIRQAEVNLQAVEAPAGEMTVVCGPGWPGVLLHEAVGHGLEGDFNRKQTSLYAGMMGKMVAAPGVTIIDDGTLTDHRGSLAIDDEGTPTQSNVLIENGRLVGYMQDRMNARLMGVAATGNGRRESYAHAPMPRMTNTFMAAGQDDPGEIIASVKDGIYAVDFGGGQVDITNGQFTFKITEDYRIRDGRIAEPIKGVTLIGNGPEVMRRVSMVGNDLAIKKGVGMCGKAGQSLPVTVGQPTCKIDAITVGGTQV